MLLVCSPRLCFILACDLFQAFILGYASYLLHLAWCPYGLIHTVYSSEDNQQI